MYTVNITGKSFNKNTSQIVLVVEFSDGTNTVNETLRFGADIPFEQIKRNLKLRARLLEEGETNSQSVTIGQVDLASIVDDPRTAAEVAAEEWLVAFRRLEKVQQLIDLGVLTGNETSVTSLRNKVATDFKASYINLF